MGIVNWRSLYLASVVAKVYFCLQTSYIHPDEHFQSFQPIVKLAFENTSIHNKWEFNEAEARSYAPLIILFYPIVYTVKLLGLPLSVAYYFVRLEFVLMTWLVTDLTIWRIMPTKPERVKALVFTSTSFVTLVFQSHTFSNSVETWLVLLCVMIIEAFRENTHTKSKDALPHYSFSLGCLCAFGIFNRVTFVAWLLIPSVFALKFYLASPKSLALTILGFSLTAFTCVALDSWIYEGTIDPRLPVITPLNNLLYNMNTDNLALHGLHSRFTHLFVNLPTMLGPSLLLLSLRYYMTTPFLSAVSGLLVLSVVPHQEFRFIAPSLPLLSCCMDLRRHKLISKHAMRLFVIFNIAMCLVFGIFHQAGIVPALEYLNMEAMEPNVVVWWRTYSPPMWMYERGEYELYNRVDDDLDTLELGSENNSAIVMVDAMGSQLDTVLNLVSQQSGAVLIAPIASVETVLADFMQGTDKALKRVWQYRNHYDMDHFEFSYGWRTLEPGLGVYVLVDK